MSLRPSASMPTTRPCRCWPRARPAPAGSGPMSATTGRSAAPIRRRRVLLLARPRRRASRAASWRLCRPHAGRRLCGLQPALRGHAQAGPDHRGGLLGAWAAQVLRSGAAQQGADRHRGGRAHRRAVRHRARDQRPAAAAARCACASERSRPLVDRARDLVARAARQALQARTIPPRRSTTASSAGRRSPASSTTAASACPTTPPNARCAPSRSGATIGPSPAPTRAAAAPPPSTR